MTVGLDSKTLLEWRLHPGLMVRELFGAVPDAWQDEVLAKFPQRQRQAMSAAKGPGKSALLAWLGWNFLLTRTYPKIAATSITADTLADTLWAEMAKWQAKSPLLQALFQWEKKRIFYKSAPENWFMTARSWSRTANAEQQGNTLAGLHADNIMFLIDEVGGVPDAVMAAAEAALASCKDGHLVIAGNPTHLSGPLYRASTSERHLWDMTNITGDPDDPMRSPRISVQWAREQIQKYGKDNPWVLVNVFGKFPPGSINALIGPEEVAEAMRRVIPDDAYESAARVLGVDVARFGGDSSVIFPRQGLRAFPPLQYRGIDSLQGAGLVARKWLDWEADACFVDDTGGFGSGWIDNLVGLGHKPIGIHFASRASDPRYHNKRAEMAFDTVEWIKGGASLPNIPELAAALTSTTYSFSKQSGALIIEDKDLVKSKIGYSPDHFDALVLTHAEPVISPRRRVLSDRMPKTRRYDPYSGIEPY